MNNTHDDQADQAQDMSIQQESAEVTNLRPSVGDELRMRREEAGHSLADLAEALRIQRRYLEALEDGRIDDLPGTVYALGFLRTYAEYYGLDGDAYVTRFKEETEGRRRSQEYVLPEPLEEARVPTAAIALIGIVLAVGAIVIWYSMRPAEVDTVGAVPEVPTNLAAPVQETASESKPAETAEVPEPAPTPEQPAPTPEQPAETPEQPAETPEPAEEAAATTASTETEVPPLAPASAEPPAAQPEPAAEAAAAPAARTETPEISGQPSPPAAEAEPPAVTTSETTPPDLSGQADEGEQVPHVPQVFGGTADPRIVITATDDSWLEISDADGNRLMSRTLRAGDSYRVPNREGLVFVTGNAGGLSIAVDGEAVPALGGIGIVRKNVKLDPELLKEGRAWP
jgi:cytoskeleton protein RodZ